MQLEGLTKVQFSGLLYLGPAFVIELLSATNKLAQNQKKMELWIANGTQLGWLDDPSGNKFLSTCGVLCHMRLNKQRRAGVRSQALHLILQKYGVVTSYRS